MATPYATASTTSTMFSLNEELVRRAMAFIIVAAAVLAPFVIRRAMTQRRESLRLPPGPRGLPLVGYLPFLRPDLHRCFADLARTYGPVMTVQLGFKLCVVVTSPEVAREVLNDHDAIFANHQPIAVVRSSRLGDNNLLWQQYGPVWRALRKVSARDLLSTRVLDSLRALREREVRRMVVDFHRKAGKPVEVGEMVFVTALNVMAAMLWGKSIVAVEADDKESERAGVEFRQLVNGVVRLLGLPNVSDFFPALEWLDLQGAQREMNKYAEKLYRILDEIIEQRRARTGRASGDEETSRDFLDVMLDLVENADPHEPLTVDNIKGLFVDMITGGTDTTTTVIEWTLAEMMCKPEIMRKAQDELKTIVGNKFVDESHLPSLQYLKALVKETLRLHPPIPLLVPHYSTETCMIGGYKIPKGTNVYIDAWAIHMNPMIWENPLEFNPERFLTETKEWDYFGSKNFNFIPFGSGRRICVGISLAERMNMLILAAILQFFDWQVPNNTGLDLEDEFGIILKKKRPLILVPTPRISGPKIYK